MSSWPETVVDVNAPEPATGAAERLSRVRELAVDLEADAMHAFRARLCYVQVATDDEVVLFDTLAPGVDVSVLAPHLADPGITKFFHAAMGDLQYLAEVGLRVAGLFDTHRAATLLGWPKVGLADLVRERAGVELTKAFQQADWSVRPLLPGMRAYLADDVRYLVEIGREVQQACRDADIYEEVVLDCNRMCHEAIARPAEGAAWKPKLPRQGPPEQRALGLAIARALHAKRLLWAEAANVPMGRMLSNAAITELAVTPPDTLERLRRIRGVRGPFVREHGETVLKLIADLKAAQADGRLPEEPEAPRPSAGQRRRYEALKEWRAARALERKITPGAVLSNPLMEQLAAEPPADVETLSRVPFFGDKRVALYGPQLVELLAKA
ncbi:MAG TPA: HRDC domain-containing protein [Myxococcaceae bacterium]|nr:HRDC domain-containing protein [Myxococcaceae bacterium]